MSTLNKMLFRIESAISLLLSCGLANAPSTSFYALCLRFDLNQTSVARSVLSRASPALPACTHVSFCMHARRRYCVARFLSKFNIDGNSRISIAVLLPDLFMRALKNVTIRRICANRRWGDPQGSIFGPFLFKDDGTEGEAVNLPFSVRSGWKTGAEIGRTRFIAVRGVSEFQTVGMLALAAA